MADQNQQHGRRPHFHRGRRGHERRGHERRGTPPPQEQPGRDHVDVEQIMREIRARISQRHGIDLTAQQIQELAARRLEAILDPRTVKPSLLEQIRRSASTPVDTPAGTERPFTFEDTTIYDSPNGAVRFFRRLLNPILKLFFNPNPVIHALHTQMKLNQAAADREGERERRQTEWNALHYDILQRLVLDLARTSLESQQLALRVEALAAKVEFAERRTRSVEAILLQARPAPRHAEHTQPAAAPSQPPREAGASESAAPPQAEGTPGEGGRRRRRRRRGRRPPGASPDVIGAPVPAGTPLADGTRAADPADLADGDEIDEEDGLVEGGDADEPPSASIEATAPPVEVPATAMTHAAVMPQAEPIITDPADETPPPPAPLGDDGPK